MAACIDGRERKDGAASADPTRSAFRALVRHVCWVTVTTPFRADGSIDEAGLQANIRAYCACGFANYRIGLVVAGTYGECLSMSDDERRLVIRLCLEAAQGEVPVVAVVLNGDGNMDRSITLARYSAQLGAAAVAIAPPSFYFSLTDDEIVHWLVAFASDADIPIVLYNLARRLKVYLDGPLIGRLLHTIPQLVAMKLDSPSLEERLEMIHAFGDEISVIEGAEPLAATTLPEGALGFMSSSATFAPALMPAWTRAIVERDSAALVAVADRFSSYRRFQETCNASPPGVLKAAMGMVGLVGGRCRPPLGPLCQHDEAELVQALLAMGLPVARNATRSDAKLTQLQR